MLTILLIFALIGTLRGMPLSLPLNDPNGFPDLDPHDASPYLSERAMSDIIFSCFATIFACTWSSVHPNIPAPTDCAWTCFKRHVVTMVYALLAPEAITAWALRQRLAARNSVYCYNERIATSTEMSKTSILDTIRAIFYDFPLPSKLQGGQVPQWTLAHGFFLQMGGFILSDGGQPIQTVTYCELEETICSGTIDPPPTTEEDIKDRSKGDVISKALIILQTTWFVAQCIARWSNQLPVTELEVVTLGFALLNGVTYGLWWHKPQNVDRPIFLEIKHALPHESSDTTLENSSAPRKESYLRRTLREDVGRHASSDLWKLVYIIPLRLIEGLIRPLAKLAEYLRRDVQPGDLRKPMFYSDLTLNDSEVYGLTSIIGVLFGSVHLTASWFLDFASMQEMWLWRVSAIVITVGPAILGVWHYSRRYSDLVYFHNIFKTILIGMLPLYIIILLTLALTSLCALPPAALQTVDWTTFIPHI